MGLYKAHLEAGNKYGVQKPNLIVVHAMGEFIGNQHAVGFLSNSKPNALSAHSLIDLSGNNYRCREDNEVAYHAAGYNIDSLGLEILVPGKHDYASFLKTIRQPYVTTVQYDEIIRQTREWMLLWGITNVVRHSDISPERKVDPGDGFPWLTFLRDIGL